MVGTGDGKWEVSQLFFADDTQLVADSKKKLEKLMEGFGRSCRRIKLKVNLAKSKVMRSATDCMVAKFWRRWQFLST